MRVAITKPDHRIVGGFEHVLGHVEAALQRGGHEVSWLKVDVPGLPRTPFGVDVPGDVWEQSAEFFRFAAMTEAFGWLDTSGFDVVLSTQPPSYAVSHPRHISLFYHHHRVFYDLSDAYLTAGFANRAAHLRAQTAVRALDAVLLGGVQLFLTPSEEVRGRLRRFQGISTSAPFQAGIGFDADLLAATATSTFDYPLCVSRHEFPKRTELFVQAMRYLPEKAGTLVGSGGRLPWVRTLDRKLGLPGADLDAYGPEELWLCRPPATVDVAAEGGDEVSSNVTFRSGVARRDLADLYGSALCVVAPAYLEDYGLTALEGLAFGKPVIVCEDGGGLTELVEDGVTGFVVEPSGQAIATAIRKLSDDPDLARALGDNGRAAVAGFTWEAAARQIADGLRSVAA